MARPPILWSVVLPLALACALSIAIAPSTRAQQTAKATPATMASPLPAASPASDFDPDEAVAPDPSATAVVGPVASATPTIPGNAPSGQERVVQAEAVRQAILDTGAFALNDATITGDLNLNGLTIERIYITNVHFEGEVDLSFGASTIYRQDPNVIRPESGCAPGELERHGAADVILDRSSFDRIVMFSDRCLTSLRCYYCTFESALVLEDAVARDVRLNFSVVAGSATLARSRLQSLGLFGAKLEDGLNLSNAIIRDIQLENTVAGGPIYVRWDELRGSEDFIAYDADTPDELQREYVERETELLFWRGNFESLGQDADAAAVKREIGDLRAARLVGCRWHSLSCALEHGWLWFNKHWHGYGTQPMRALLLSILIVILCAVGYRVAGEFEAAKRDAPPPTGPGTPSTGSAALSPLIAMPSPNHKTMFFCLLYSLDAFVPFRIASGVKDEYGLKAMGSTRAAVSIERVAGGFLSVLTIAPFIL